MESKVAIVMKNDPAANLMYFSGMYFSSTFPNNIDKNTHTIKAYTIK